MRDRGDGGGGGSRDQGCPRLRSTSRLTGAGPDGPAIAGPARYRPPWTASREERASPSSSSANRWRWRRTGQGAVLADRERRLQTLCPRCQSRRLHPTTALTCIVLRHRGGGLQWLQLLRARLLLRGARRREEDGRVWKHSLQRAACRKPIRGPGRSSPRWPTATRLLGPVAHPVWFCVLGAVVMLAQPTSGMLLHRLADGRLDLGP